MDIGKFMAANLCQRESEVKVGELSEWFEDGAKPVWKVRGMTSAELARAKFEAQEGKRDLKTLISALAGSDSEREKAIQEAAGLSTDDVPQDVAQRIEYLLCASVEPHFKREQRDAVVRLAEHFPTTFYTLTNEILSLTGQGSEVGKRKASGRKKVSEPS